MTSTIKIEAQGSYLRLSVKHSIKEDRFVARHYPVQVSRVHKTSKGAKRGVITQFTRKSRKRLLELFSRIILPEKKLFLTLTYGQKYPDPKTAKRHIDTYGKRLRRAHPDCVFIWRIEPQERGAPHFHIIILGKDFIPVKDIRKDWLEVIGNEYANNAAGTPKCPSMKIKRLDSRKQVFYYVSKYIAKEALNFNAVPYLTAQQKCEYQIGRQWGIIGRVNLDFAILVTATLAFNSNALWQFRFEAGKVWNPVRRMVKNKGFSLFTDRAYELLSTFISYDSLLPPHELTNHR